MTAAMRRFVLGLALALTSAAVRPPAQAAASHKLGARPRATAVGYTHDAQRVLAQARAAAGGAAWNYLRGWHETGHRDGVAYETWLDPLRFGLRVEVHTPQGLQVHGFNGLGAWKIAPGGEATGTGDEGPVGQARAEAFYGVYGFYFPGRFDAHGDYLGTRQLGGRAFDVVEVKPWSGAARQLWFDRHTHLLARMVDANGPKPVTVELSDYRKVGPVKVAFRYVAQATDEAVAEVRQLDSLAFTPADRAMFSLPRPAGP
jgi:hypothetical protein